MNAKTFFIRLGLELIIAVVAEVVAYKVKARLTEKELENALGIFDLGGKGL